MSTKNGETKENDSNDLDFTCNECDSIPNFLNLNYSKTSIEFACKIHGPKEISIKDYLSSLNEKQKEKECTSQSISCEMHPSNYISYYCYNCEKYFCDECLKNNSKECENYHKKISLQSILLKNDDIQYLKNKTEKYKKFIDNFNDLIKINEIFISNYEKNNLLNVINTLKYINNVKKFEEKQNIFFKSVDKSYSSNYKNLAALNKAYHINLSLEDSNIILTQSKLFDDALRKINDIEFENINKLDLSDNYIKNIDSFAKSNLNNLEIINLSKNNITNLSSLSLINLSQLKELNLSWNNINNIDKLNKANFNTLKVLNLSFNKIKDIDIIENLNLNELKVLNLSGNAIEKIEVIIENLNSTTEKINKLEDLNLSSNKISFFGTAKNGFKNEKLMKMNLSFNLISNIEIFSKVKFENLIYLDLSGNKINSIKVLETRNLPKLSRLNLAFNSIMSATSFLKNSLLENLVELNIYGNLIAFVPTEKSDALKELKKINLSFNKWDYVRNENSIKRLEEGGITVEV